MAEKALTAWNRLWELMIRENNFSNQLGSQILDWQIGNWAQDVSIVLHNAKLYQDEIAIDKQILKIDWKRNGHDNNFHDNAKRDIADAYADLGDLTTSYKLYEQYLDEEPLGEDEKAKDCAERIKSTEKTTQSGFFSSSFLNPVINKKKVYPNELCTCGSGKKYKKCCGRK